VGRIDELVFELSDDTITDQRFLRLATNLGLSIPALLTLIGNAERFRDPLPSSGILIERNGESVDAPAPGGD
jgi:hypothetical protein